MHLRRSITGTCSPMPELGDHAMKSHEFVNSSAARYAYLLKDCYLVAAVLQGPRCEEGCRATTILPTLDLEYTSGTDDRPVSPVNG
jgi:hypothetical protein